MNDAKRVSKVATFLQTAEIMLGDVLLHDGSIQPRSIETWIPKKQITAWNPRQAPAFAS